MAPPMITGSGRGCPGWPHIRPGWNKNGGGGSPPAPAPPLAWFIGTGTAVEVPFGADFYFDPAQSYGSRSFAIAASSPFYSVTYHHWFAGVTNLATGAFQKIGYQGTLGSSAAPVGFHYGNHNTNAAYSAAMTGDDSWGSMHFTGGMWQRRARMTASPSDWKATDPEAGYNKTGWLYGPATYTAADLGVIAWAPGLAGVWGAMGTAAWRSSVASSYVAIWDSSSIWRPLAGPINSEWLIGVAPYTRLVGIA